MNVKKNDTVIVLSGKDKGKKGKVLEAMPAAGKVVVEGVNVATCHVKPKKQGDQGGIINREIPMYASKVMLVCPKCGKATRHAVKLADGKKVRVCRKGGACIPMPVCRHSPAVPGCTCLPASAGPYRTCSPAALLCSC